jgi:patatin-like phospholipase/acyl hydrolase
MTYNIVSFDGGGVCGTFSIQLFRRILKERSGLLHAIDLFAGTSTGGLIGLALAQGVHPDDILRLYQTKTEQIFARGFFKKVFGNLCGSKYGNDGLIKVAYDTFGNATLDDLHAHVVVPAFNLKEEGTPNDPSWRCEFFNNFSGSPFLKDKIADVAIRTASAPTYFPSYQGYIDGGVVANDPSLAAVAMAVSQGFKLEDIRVLSIGTGGQIRYIDGKEITWGIAGWIKPLVNVFMGGQSITVDALTGCMLQNRYRRLCPIIPDIEMDDVSKVPTLIALADQVDIKPVTDWLDAEVFGRVSDLTAR